MQASVATSTQLHTQRDTGITDRCDKDTTRATWAAFFDCLQSTDTFPSSTNAHKHADGDVAMPFSLAELPDIDDVVSGHLAHIHPHQHPQPQAGLPSSQSDHRNIVLHATLLSSSGDVTDNASAESDALTASHSTDGQQHLFAPLSPAVLKKYVDDDDDDASDDAAWQQMQSTLMKRAQSRRTVPRIACNNKRAEDMQYDQYLDCAIVDVRRLLATGRLSQEEYTGILRARRRNTNRLASAKRRITQLGGKTSSPTSPASSSPSSQQPQRLAMLEELRQLQEREAGLRSAIAAKEQQLASIE